MVSLVPSALATNSASSRAWHICTFVCGRSVPAPPYYHRIFFRVLLHEQDMPEVVGLLDIFQCCAALLGEMMDTLCIWRGY